MTKLIDKDIYAKIVEQIPILCVDLVIEREDGHFLTVKRVNEPLKDEFWVPGGRVMRNEKLLDAAKRIAKQEIGFIIDDLWFYGMYEGFFKKSAANMKSGIHTVSAVFSFKVGINRATRVELDEQSSSYKWARALPVDFINNTKRL